MPATPEVLRPETQVQERPEEFVVPETLQQSTGVKVVQKNFTAQVKGDKGIPLVSASPTQVISVAPPASSDDLTKQSKGSVASSLTWLAAFWLRVLKKAMHFGWQVVGKN